MTPMAASSNMILVDFRVFLLFLWRLSCSHHCGLSLTFVMGHSHRRVYTWGNYPKMMCSCIRLTMNYNKLHGRTCFCKPLCHPVNLTSTVVVLPIDSNIPYTPRRPHCAYLMLYTSYFVFVRSIRSKSHLFAFWSN